MVTEVITLLSLYSNKIKKFHPTYEKGTTIFILENGLYEIMINSNVCMISHNKKMLLFTSRVDEVISKLEDIFKNEYDYFNTYCGNTYSSGTTFSFSG